MPERLALRRSARIDQWLVMQGVNGNWVFLLVSNHGEINPLKYGDEMILIADDNAEVRRMICSLVEEIDDQVIECADGREAIDAYELHRPSWVLMDINMHPLDGLTASKEILTRHPNAKIIIVSQHHDERTRETAFGIGAYAFVGKEDLMSLREIIQMPQISAHELLDDSSRVVAPAKELFL